MKVLITGVGGFAGGHLAAALLRRGDEVTGIDTVRGAQIAPLAGSLRFVEMDMRDAGALLDLYQDARPDAIVHLAALSDVGGSWQQRRATLEVNVFGTSAVLEAAAKLGSSPRVVIASTGEVYGQAPEDTPPLREDAAMQPRSPYAASKLCSEALALQAWHGTGVPTVVLRTFNYTGPWQAAPAFVCPDFARQVARIEAGLQAPRMRVGNLETHRDFSDVRDIVDGYLLAIDNGAPGVAYNLASGRGTRIGDVLDHLLRAASVDIEVGHDPAKIRRADLQARVGDATRARRELGWEPRFDFFDDTLPSVLEFWRQQTAEER